VTGSKTTRRSAEERAPSAGDRPANRVANQKCFAQAKRVPFAHAAVKDQARYAHPTRAQNARAGTLSTRLPSVVLDGCSAAGGLQL
jgi:hypothetical protein